MSASRRPPADDPRVGSMLHSFVQAVRKVGVRASLAEVVDAHRATVEVGLAHRAEVKAAWRASLAKSVSEAALFDAVFDEFFAASAAAESAEAAILTDEEQRKLETQFRSDVTDDHAEAAFALLAGGAALTAYVAKAVRELDLASLASSLQIGLFTHRALAQVGLDELRPIVERVERELAEDWDGDRARTVRRRLQARWGEARRLARQEVLAALRRQEPLALPRSQRARLLQTRFRELRRDEVTAMDREVRRLGERLRGRLSVRRRRFSRGRIDVRQTVRESRKTHGVLVKPVHRRRRQDRPRLIVLVDISDSVRNAARFFLSLVHTIQTAFVSTRSFVFVREVSEVTATFRKDSREDAMTLVYRGSNVPVTTGSDYGHAFGAFEELVGGVLDSRTTLIVLGDGRTNRLDPNVAAFARLAQRVRRVLWLNPEPEPAWGLGDSAMPAWLPYVEKAMYAGDLKSLRRALDLVLRELRP